MYKIFEMVCPLKGIVCITGYYGLLRLLTRRQFNDQSLNYIHRIHNNLWDNSLMTTGKTHKANNEYKV